jgi:hypothetical protein
MRLLKMSDINTNNLVTATCKGCGMREKQVDTKEQAATWLCKSCKKKGEK